MSITKLMLSDDSVDIDFQLVCLYAGFTFYVEVESCVELSRYLHSLASSEFTETNITDAKKLLDSFRDNILNEMNIKNRNSMRKKVESSISFYTDAKLKALIILLKHGVIEDDDANGMLLQSVALSRHANKSHAITAKNCAVCGEPSTHRCSKCVVYYCSKKHQKEDWKTGHREHCGEVRYSRPPFYIKRTPS